jgi:hypothetical protein
MSVTSALYFAVLAFNKATASSSDAAITGYKTTLGQGIFDNVLNQTVIFDNQNDR